MIKRNLIDFVKTYSGVLTKDECIMIIDAYLNSPQAVSTVADEGEHLEIRKGNEASLLSVSADIDGFLKQKMVQVFQQYTKDIGEEFGKYLFSKNGTAEEFRIKEYYQNQGYYKEHSDDVGVRKLAIIFYLNTVHKGGETEFPHLHDEWNNSIKITPDPGKVLVFPTTFLFPHAGLMPLSGNKYIAQCYINGD